MRFSGQRKKRVTNGGCANTMRSADLSAFGTGRYRVATLSGPSSAMACSLVGGKVCCQAGDAGVRPVEPLGRIRRAKVRAIRGQLRLGKYNVDSRLAAILDRLLDDLVT